MMVFIGVERLLPCAASKHFVLAARLGILILKVHLVILQRKMIVFKEPPWLPPYPGRDESIYHERPDSSCILILSTR